MNIKELYDELIEAYSSKNLNLLTGKLILLYKNKNYGKIREIANIVSQYVPIDEENDAKCFSKLIMLYHPDKGDQFRKTIQQLYEQNDYENLNSHSHIILITDIDTMTVKTVDENIDYEPEYVWDPDINDGYSFTDSSSNGFETVDFEKSFYNMIKIREYGNVNIEFPSYYLEDFEEYEMAFCGLESLDGLEHCIHIKSLDVSNNELSDLENLWDLGNLEELYLANNQIAYIDSLSNLTKLIVVDLSGNQIEDISPLFELEHLEYVNLIGNPVNDGHIDLLEKKGVIVMTESVPT